MHLGAMLVRDQVQRLLVHRAVGEDLLAVGPVSFQPKV